MIYGLLAIGLVLRLISIDQSFWLDEAAQAVLSAKPIFSVNYAADFQPPLYYVFSNIWMQLGSIFGESIAQTEWFLRLPSVLFGLGTIYLLYVLLKDKFNEKVALTAAALLNIAPFHIYYSQEFRMYSALTFLGILSWYLLDRKRWLLYSIVIGTSVFTHYFAFVLLLSQVLYMLVVGRKNWKCFFGASALGITPFVLWIPTFLKQIETSRQLLHAWPGWEALSNIGFVKFPFTTLAKFTVGMISPDNKMLYAGVVGIMGLVFTIALGRLFLHTKKSNKNEQKNLLFLGMYFFAPLAIAWVGGIFVSASTPWRIQFVLPAFYTLLAIGLSTKIQPRIPTQVLNGLLAVIILIQITFTSQYLFQDEYHREDWKNAIQYTDERIGETGVAITEYVGPWAPMDWYADNPAQYKGGSSTQRVASESVIIPEESPVVLFSYLFEISDPERHIETQLMDNGYMLQEEKDFRGVGIIRIFEST